MGKIKEICSKIVENIKSKPKLYGVVLLGVFVFIYLVCGGVAKWKADRAAEEVDNDNYVGNDLPSGSYTDYDQGTQEYQDLYDQEILIKQDQLIQKYGKVPDGFLWDLDGSLVSLGEPDMTAEEVLYAYLNGIRTLDFSSAQKFSRGSKVINRYSGFFDTSDAMSASYVDSFYRNMYTQVLKSIQVKGVESAAVFAANRQVFTVQLEMLDLSSKDFWEEDKYDIYNTLYIYSGDEDDAVKSEQYVYNYVMDYYKSPTAVKKNVTVNITVEKYARLGTGWLVTIDKDVDDYCYYTDGNVVSKYILRSYQEEGREYIKQIRDEEEEAKKAAENVDTEVTDGEAEGNDDEVIEGDPGDDA